MTLKEFDQTETIMATQKLKNKISKELKSCDKCGSVMVNRVIISNHSHPPKKSRILQCIMCKHWIELD